MPASLPALFSAKVGQDFPPGDAMKYIDEILQPGETVLFDGTIHWLVYVPGLLLLLVGAALFASAGIFPPLVLGAAVVFFLSVVSLLRAWVQRFTTEIAVTNRRIIYKHGFIRRRTIEMNMEKVESVDVSQSIPGRIFNYGDVLIRGVGVGFEPLHMIDNPIKLRNAIIAK
jgi:uncharacterized membrane protein YdbT with pleckstrin-like domain